MSRSENIAVVESYLSGLARKDLSSVPFAPGITFEGPLMPKLAGRETIVAFLTSIFPFIKGKTSRTSACPAGQMGSNLPKTRFSGTTKSHTCPTCRLYAQ
jgi:hypothetical protein